MARTLSRSVQGIHERIADVVVGMTFAELGAITECNAETARRYVNGDSVPSIQFVARLAQVTDVSLRWLVTGEGPRYDRRSIELDLQELSLRELFSAIGDRVGLLEEAEARRAEEAQRALEARDRITKEPPTEAVAGAASLGLRLTDDSGGDSKLRRRGPRNRRGLSAAIGTPFD